MDHDDDEEAALERPYLFYVGEEEVKATLRESLKRVIVNRERTLPIVYKPQASGRTTMPSIYFSFWCVHRRSETNVCKVYSIHTILLTENTQGCGAKLKLTKVCV